MNDPMPPEGVARLTHLGVIRARGPDATRFLQSQLTNDVAGMGLAEARLAGFCSAKGRLQASFLFWKAATDDVLLACSATLLAQTLKRLSMFVLRAQCKLTDASQQAPLLGLVGAAAAAAAADAKPWEKRDMAEGTVIRLPDVHGLARCLVAASTSADAAWATTPFPLEDWRWLEVQSGIPTIESSTVDQFVPQMLNLEVLGGVDFQKGCYPGQEVVARSQYRGTLKRRMFLFDCDAAASAGQEVFHGADPSQPAGMVVNGAKASSGAWSALVELKLAALDGGTLHLGSADGAPLQRAELPYALP
jgi:folate-binding protein YgfZ